MNETEYRQVSEKYKLLVEAELQRIFREDASDIFPSLREAMTFSLEAGGKRLRPCLMLAVCEMLGGKAGSALPYACALEMIHTSSLIHDDLPCMDDDDMRRGRPSNHKVFGEAAALLAGDALQAFASETMVAALEKNCDPNCVKAAAEIERRAGAAGMLTGQAADMEFEKSGVRTAEALRYVHEHKTADMLTAAVLAGALIAGADEKTLSSLRVYSEKMGLLFQITDDILDFSGDPALMGKTLGKDEKSGKLTYAVMLGLDGAEKAAREAAEEAKAAAADVDKAGYLAAVIDNMLVRSN